MPIPSVMSDLSITAASNSPAGSESPTAGDDNIRALAAIVRTTNTKGSDIASASTTNIGAATGEFVDVTGVVTIISFGTIAAGIVRTVRFTGILTLTHNATSLILPSAANIITAANDTAELRSLGAGNWVCINYKRQDGSATAPTTDTSPIVKGSADATKLVRLEVDGLTTATTRVLTVSDKDITIAGLDDIKQIQSVTATQAAGALTLGTNPSSFEFRSTTLTNGVPVTRTLAVASSLVIPSGATLGIPTATSGTLIKGLLDNAGVLEEFATNLAGGLNLDETGLISTTAISVGSTSATVIYSTTARTNVAYRITGLVDVVNTGGVYSNPSRVQGAGGQALEIIPKGSCVRLNTDNGYGSTNTKIKRFLTTVLNQGADITYADSATLGASFTINATGSYAMSYTDRFSIVAGMGVTLNSTQPTINIGASTIGNILAILDTPAANFTSTVSTTVYLAAGSVIRAHSDGAAAGASAITLFTITRVD